MPLLGCLFSFFHTYRLRSCLIFTADLTTTINTLHTTFLAELEPKSSALSAAQAQLLTTTADLARERRAVQAVQGDFKELDLVKRRIGNLQQALERLRNSQEGGEWGEMAVEGKGKGKETANGATVDIDPILSPIESSADARTQLPALRRIKAYQTKIFALLEGKMAGIVRDGEDKARLFRKIICICSGLKEDVVGEVRTFLIPPLLLMPSQKEMRENGHEQG